MTLSIKAYSLLIAELNMRITPNDYCLFLFYRGRSIDLMDFLSSNKEMKISITLNLCTATGLVT